MGGIGGERGGGRWNESVGPVIQIDLRNGRKTVVFVLLCIIIIIAIMYYVLPSVL